MSELDHVAQLQKMRGKMLDERRIDASRGQWSVVVKQQLDIEIVDRAIVDEQALAQVGALAECIKGL